MYIAITGKGKARVIQLCEQHRISGTSKKKTTVVKTYGNYEKMFKENPNIINELKEEARKITKLKKEKLLMEKKKYSDNNKGVYRFGHILVKELWEKNKLEDFFILHFKEEGKKISEILLSLIVYRLGSSYKNFRTNRKIPFLNLSSVSLEDFYYILEKISEIQDELSAYLYNFFNKNTLTSRENIYCHISSYYYSSYWKNLKRNDRKETNKDEYVFKMLLLFDDYGIPISHILVENNFSIENALKKMKSKLDIKKIIFLSKEFSLDEEKKFVFRKNLNDISEKTKKRFLKNYHWNILERDQKNDEILKKDINLPINLDEKLYVHWSKKTAFNDYLEENSNNGYFCLHTNDMSLDNTDMLKIYNFIWKIEEKFLINNVNFNKKRIQGHFILCLLSLMFVRYFQYLIGDEGKVFIPMIYANKAISNPLVLFQNFEEIIPLHITNSYLKLAKALGIGELFKSMDKKYFQQYSNLNLSEIENRNEKIDYFSYI